MAGRKPKKRTVSAAAACLSLAILTAAAGIAAYLTMGDFPPISNPFSSASPSESDGGAASLSPGEEILPVIGEDEGESGGESAETGAEQTAEANRPSEFRAVTLKAGVDYDAAGDEAENKALIDQALADAKEMTMNTIVIDTVTADGEVLFSSGSLPQAEQTFDAVGYLAERARAEGFYVYATFETLGATLSGGVQPVGAVTMDRLDALESEVEAFVRTYQPDGVLLDGYYNMDSDRSYADYLKNGGGEGYENYMLGLSRAAVAAASTSARRAMPGIDVGLLTEAVWANASYDERGSQTSAPFTTRYGGNSDATEYLTDGLAGFAAVKAFGATTDSSMPFEAVAGWWSEALGGTGTPLVIVHAADRAVTEAEGWGEYDQLARQVIEARKLQNFAGSIFNSMKRLQENPKDCAGKLVQYYNDEIKPEHIMTDLTLTKPSQMTYTTFDPNVIFAGATDPNTDATINDQKITIDENGFFSMSVDLEPGLNTFVIRHKGKVYTYNITRQVEVLQEISPGGNMNVDGGTKITITAIAYENSAVYAMVGGTKVAMSPSEAEGDDVSLHGAYKKYVGVYTAPNATTSEQNLGNVTVYGSWGQFTGQKTGALLKVNARALPSDGTPVKVVAEWAVTYPTDRIAQYSEPGCLPLPNGALDYAIGNEIVYNNGSKTYRYYNLQSGLRVLSDDISVVSASEAPANNRISGYSVDANERFTEVTINTAQKVSYTAKYNGSTFTVQFHYTNSVPKSMPLDQNPLFSNAAWSGDTLTLTLLNKNCFMGYHGYFNDDGQLVLRFNNLPASLSDATIVIDPGHGGNDPGAIGFLAAYPEKVINYAIGSYLADELSARGAKVIKLDTQNNNIELIDRVRIAASYNPHLYIAVHANSSSVSSAASGTEAYYFTPYSYLMARYAAQTVAGALGTANRGGKFGEYLVTRNTQFASILVETGFVSNETEYRKLIDDGYQAEIASAIANAAEAYFESMCQVGTYITGSQSSGDMSPDAASGGVGNAGLSLDRKNLTLKTGESEALVPSLDDVEWTSSDTKVVTVDEDGVVTAVGPGTASVTAEDRESGLKASCAVTVSGSGGGASSGGEEPSDGQGSGPLALSPAKITLSPEESAATQITYSGEGPVEIEWKIETTEGEDVAVASVDGADVTITAVNLGRARFTASVKGQPGVSAACEIVVKD